MIDFTTMDDAEIATFAVAHRDDLDAGGLEQNNVLEALRSGLAVIERRPFGFAFLRLPKLPNGKSMPFLWLLFVLPEQRGRRLGHHFVRELLAKYSTEYHMSLHCYGAARRRFFGRLGFVVEGRHDEMRQMTTHREHRLYR